MNERYSVDGGYIGWYCNDDRAVDFTVFVGLIEWVLGKRNGQWMSFLTRNTLINAGRLAPPTNMM